MGSEMCIRDRALIAAGITEDMVRISVGIEDVSDIQDDFNKGFRAAKKFC